MAGALRKVEVARTGRAAEIRACRDPLSVAREAIKAEAQRRGLSEDYDEEDDVAGIAAALSEALYVWRHGRGTGEPLETRGTAATPSAAASSFSTLCARWMRCPECGSTESFVIELRNGPVFALSEDLTYTYTSAEEEAHAKALCGSCAHEGPVGTFS